MKTQAVSLNMNTDRLQRSTLSQNEKRAPTCQNIETMLVLLLFALLAFTNYVSAQELSPLNIGDEKHGAHVLPPPNEALLRQSQPQGPLVFKGGPVMGAVETYAIFWVPPTLQNGKPTGISAGYLGVLTNMLQNYSGHGIDNNNTQYNSDCVGWVTAWGGGVDDYACGFIPPGWSYYIPNAGSFKGAYTDTTPYPTSGCNDPVPGIGTNCINDAQIQAEIQKVMNLRGWKGGLNAMFLLFTSQGEGSCFDNGPIYCSYNYYCAYHSDINNAGRAIVYGNEPYGDPTYCQTAGTPSPNNDPAADTAATAASHELTEAITDPLYSNPAWRTANGKYEIGDLCAYNYGNNTWDNGNANQMWNGAFFELQTEYDNHTSSCVQVGP